MITISSSLKTKCPLLKCHFLHGTIINKKDEEVSAILNELSRDEDFYDTGIPGIQDARKAYKSCGKEPSRYRPSAEALRRRIRTGKGLYKVNTAVDIINIVSIKSGISIGGYDASRINGGITMDIGGNEDYQAIGRGPLNIEFLPCLYDQHGPFGSPTSDSERTMITVNSEHLLMVFFDFGQHPMIVEWMNYARALLKKYCNFKPIE